MTVITQRQTLTTQGVGIMYKKRISINGVIYISGINGGYAIKRKREEAEKVKPQQTDSITDKTAKSAVKRKRVQEQ